MLMRKSGPTDCRHCERLGESGRHRGLHAVVVLVVVSVLASACGSSSKVTASADSKPVVPGTTVAQTSKDSGPLAKIAGTWTSIDGNKARFCAVGSAIGSPGDAPTTTQAPECQTLVNWGVINGVEIDAGGHMSVSFSYQPAGQPDAAEPDSVFHDGTCEATAKITGEQLGLDGLVCRPTKNDQNTFDSAGLADVTWKLDGSCLDIDNSWFEQTSGECKDHITEQKFGDVGNAIGNAS